MSRYLTGAQQGRAPYHLLVSLSACRCDLSPQTMGTARDVDRLVPAAQGYWDLYVAFWGHLPRLLSVSIVDVRDGAVMWRNGKSLLQEDASGKVSNNAQPVRNARGVGRRDPRVGPDPNRRPRTYGA